MAGAFLLFHAGQTVQAATLVVVSAASYAPAVAPDSMAALFGSGLASSAAQARPDSSGRLPVDLAGTRVEINGRAAQLIFVSPGQVNCVVPTETELGNAQVVVKVEGATVASASVAVSLAAPAVFTSDGSGQGSAAALNAVTFAPGPFSVLTQANAGEDKRTRIAIYGTGLRYAGNPARDPDKRNVAADVQLVAAIFNGDTDVPVTLEYAGAAPGFAGLDQLNVVLPFEAGGARSLEFVIGVGEMRTGVFTIPMVVNTQAPESGLRVSPSQSFDIEGVAGTFRGGTEVKTYRLSNAGKDPLQFSVRTNVGWLALSRTSGAIAPGQTVDVVVSITAAINAVGPGYAWGAIDFLGDGMIYTRIAYLTARGGGGVSPSSCEIVTVPTAQSFRMVNDRTDRKTVFIGNLYSTTGQLVGAVSMGFEMGPKTCQVVGLPRTGTYEVEAPIGSAKLRVAFDGSPGFLIGGRRVYTLRMASGGCNASDQFDGQPAYSVCF